MSEEAVDHADGAPMDRPEIIANIERDGKYVFGTVACGEHKVYERIPLHVMHKSEEEQKEVFTQVLLRLRKKLGQVMAGRAKAHVPCGAMK